MFVSARGHAAASGELSVPGETFRPLPTPTAGARDGRPRTAGREEGPEEWRGRDGGRGHRNRPVHRGGGPSRGSEDLPPGRRVLAAGQDGALAGGAALLRCPTDVGFAAVDRRRDHGSDVAIGAPPAPVSHVRRPRVSADRGTGKSTGVRVPYATQVARFIT